MALFFKDSEIPQFIKEGKTPGDIPLISFPEISMHGATPWGGFGANPLPRLLQDRDAATGHLYHGGFLYSEGIFEDINKIISLALYWGGGRLKESSQILKEYARFEFSQEYADEIAEILSLMETTLERHRKKAGDKKYRFIISNPEPVNEIHRRVLAVDAKLDEKTRRSWRWRIVYLRAKIDEELVRSDYYLTETCDTYFNELTAIYHAPDAEYAVAPPTLKSILENRGPAQDFFVV